MSSRIISMNVNVKDIQRVIDAFNNLQDTASNFTTDSIQELERKIEQEINKLNEAINHVNELKQLIEDKTNKCEDKINKKEDEKTKTEQDIEKINADIASKESQIAALSSNPLTAGLAIALEAEVAALVALRSAAVAKLAAIKAEIVRLKGVLETLKRKNEEADKLENEINQSISKFDEIRNKISEEESKISDTVSEISSKTSDAANYAENALSALNEYLGDAIEKYQATDGKFKFENKFVREDELKHIKITEQEKADLTKETNYSNSILDNVRSIKEAKFYSSINLTESTLDGKPCLKQPTIDFETPIPERKNGKVIYRTNLERMLKGEGPLLPNGEKIELHHVGQDPNSPLAELSVSQHRRGEQNKLLHTSTNVASKIDRHYFAMYIRKPYWKARAQEYLKNKG